MVYVLGITRPWGFNNAAVLLKDGEIVAAIEEERLNRIKYAKNMLPKMAIEHCLKQEGIRIEDVDRIAVGSDSCLKTASKQAALLLRKPWNPSFMRLPLEGYKVFRKYGFFKRYKRKIDYITHHDSHSASAFYCSGFDKSNILSIDGIGETTSTAIGYGVRDKMKQVEDYDFTNSLGLLYSSFTKHLGFREHIDEWKVMGLSSYGKPIFPIDGLIRFSKKGYSTDTFYRFCDYHRSLIKYIKEGTKLRLDANFTERFGIRRKEDEKIIKRHTNVAATCQTIYEQALIKLATFINDLTRIRYFSLAGGCALNCVANGALLEQDFVDDIFVQPAANDAGTALGAAILSSFGLGVKKKARMEHVYYGPQYSDEEIKRTLQRNRLKFDYYKDIEGKAAELLAKEKLVGWFQGRMEFGPRALGNRSILATPTRIRMRDKVNISVKHREYWRPFAPSMLENAADEYLENAHKSPFMNLNFRVKQEKWGEIPAVVHIDGTARVQTVNRSANAKYFRLISEFEKETGIPVLLNTSFNDNEEPIVCSPEDATLTFKKTGLDYLAIGNYLVRK
ncbi:carbamoyl transferase [Candidatus Woesearchaeota archaeon CG10_big_fil_rev_8_21_14_0_10_44_13]|nr:MAG: carbamoyl transferase [Candidatus Woesearchaeota archaeon CG10_big_fil_rev_8_21_14_0_10_44_13]